MLKIIAILLSICLAGFLLDKFFLFLETKGWLYWRKKKPDYRGGFGNALQELNQMLSPSTRYTIEAKKTQNKKSEQAGNKDK